MTACLSANVKQIHDKQTNATLLEGGEERSLLRKPYNTSKQTGREGEQNIDGCSHIPCVYMRIGVYRLFKNGTLKRKRRGGDKKRNGEIKGGKEPTGMLSLSSFKRSLT